MGLFAALIFKPAQFYAGRSGIYSILAIKADASRASYSGSLDWHPCTMVPLFMKHPLRIMLFPPTIKKTLV